MLLRLPIPLLVFCLCNQLLPMGSEVSSWLCLFLLLLLSTFTSCILTPFTWGILRKYTYFVRGIYVCDCYVFLKNWPLLFNALHCSCLITFLVLKSASEIPITSPAIIWLVSAWYVFIDPFTSILPKSFILKQVSWRQRLVQSCFLYALWQSLCFNLNHPH